MFFPGKISPSSEMPSAFTHQQAGGTLAVDSLG